MIIVQRSQCRSCFDKPVLSLSKGSARTGFLIRTSFLPFALSLSKGEHLWRTLAWDPLSLADADREFGTIKTDG
jgi:hypothetical protein